ncbi:hypothetical protein AURDEDRAFT_112283 [Auricularia subglabra TFB-10046 SS5]|nr:hypothetical protein AURDEDRAFT_112283 [Auricularia subglabra TFB-10046 SS5]
MADACAFSPRMAELLAQAAKAPRTPPGVSAAQFFATGGGQVVPPRTLHSTAPASPPAAIGGEHHNGTRSSTPLRRSATWSPSSEPSKRRTWAERRKKLQMSRDVSERRGHPKTVKKRTVQPAPFSWPDRDETPFPPSPVATPAAWCPDPSWEDYAEFKTAGWVQNDKQVDDIAATLAKW